MPQQVGRLNSYLAAARASVDTADAGPVVIGNEAADLDSMVSAMLYGMLASECRSPGGPPLVAVINCPRADFVLRTEAAYLFGALGVDVAALVFIDEIDLERPHRDGRLRLTLVDHNILSADQARYEDAVAAIIDHHPDGGLYTHADPRIIEPVGSCATLVAEAIRGGKPALLDAGEATLLLGTILLDTVNLDAAAERVTDKDEAVAARLVEIAGADPGDLFETLEAEKFNVSALGTRDLLRKDYKEWDTPSGTYGISTVLTSLENWVAKDPILVAGLDAYVRSRKLACLVAMMAFTDTGADSGGFHRQLAVYAPDSALMQRVAAMLEAGGLGLSRIRPNGLIDADRALMFDQHTLSMSRKKVQPMMHRLFAGDGG